MQLRGQLYLPTALASRKQRPVLFCRRVAGSQCRSGRLGGEKDLFRPLGIEGRFHGRAAHSPVTLPTVPSPASVFNAAVIMLSQPQYSYT